MFSADGYHALRRGAGLVRRGDRGVLLATGQDRLAWLQGLLTNDVAALPIGGVCDAAYLTPQGRMITDARVVNLDGRTLLDVPAVLAEGLRAKLDTLLFSEDAHVEDVPREMSIVDVHGPAAAGLIQRTNAELPADVVAVRDDAYGMPGFSLFTPIADVDRVITELTAAGAVETTLATLDVIRVEAGRPAFLIDMDDHTIPLEAGIEGRTISFTKGCYVGQEVIVRVMQRGQGRVAKKLVGLHLQGSDVPPAGSPIRAGDREVGRITSAVWSPSLEHAIALGYVHRDYLEHGTAVEVRVSASVVHAAIQPLPFIPAGGQEAP